MAITSTVALNDGQTVPVSHSFEATRTLPNGIDRIKSGTTLSEPIILSVRHSYTPSKGGNDAFDRHTVTCKATKIDAAGKTHECTMMSVSVIPRSEEFTSADLDDLHCFVRNFVWSYRTDLRLSKS